ncbi:hypothetical protein IFM89_037101 [Coptis chinensis]|uniref:Reverse transcriptase zinc-binding domain-containing protein n=1 Tax=Coptis chinensis TaxID=261450 RepID=A0A835HSG6_9MAGN|nr:hypothetical protein IFM89_037101 [Coptis chinensis]
MSMCILESAQGQILKLCQKCAATDAAMQRRGLQMASKCYLGCQAEENLQHIIWDCRFAKDLWEWVAWQFGFRGFTNLKEAISRCNHRSTIIVHLWTAAVMEGGREFKEGCLIADYKHLAGGKLCGDLAAKSCAFTFGYLGSRFCMREDPNGLLDGNLPR